MHSTICCLAGRTKIILSLEVLVISQAGLVVARWLYLNSLINHLHFFSIL